MGLAHDHSHSPAGTQSSPHLWGVLFLNLTYMVAEIVGGLYSGSLALLADAGHMAVDAAAVGLGLFAIWVSSKPPNAAKTFGYHRAEILAALVNGVVLAGASLGISVEAIRRLFHPVSIGGSAMTWVAVGGLLVNLCALALLRAQRGRSLNLKGVWLHLLTDTLGSVATVVAALAIWKLGWNWVDPVASLGIGLFILVGVWRLLVDCVNVLLEAVPEGVSVSALKEDLEKIAGVVEVHDLHVWSVKAGSPALSAHVRMARGFQSGAVLDALTTHLSTHHHIHHATLQIEPPEFLHSKDLDCF